MSSGGGAMRFLAKLLALLVALPALYLGWTAAGVYRISGRDDRARSHAIVVMGAAQYDGRPSPVFRSRLDHARALFEDDVAPLVVVLGGKREGDRYTEAEAGAAYLERDLPASRVTGVKAGRTTLESLRAFAGWAEPRGISRVVIVSDPLHLARAEAMARDLGFDAAGSPSTLHPGRRRLGSELARETLLLAAYRVAGRG